MARSMSEILSTKSEPESLRGEELPDEAETTSEKPEVEVKPESKPEAKDASEKPAPKPEHDGDEDEHVPDDLAGLKKALAAARGDKRKARRQWQETERAMAELRGQLSVLRQPQQPSQEHKPKSQPAKLGDQLYTPETMEAYLEARENKLREEFNAREHRRREKSVARARAAHEDFQAAWDAAVEMTRNNPALEAQLLDEDDLGEAAYQYGKNYLRFSKYKSAEEFEAEIEAKIRAEYEAKQGQSQPLPAPIPAPKNPIPRSLASVRGTGVGVQPEWTGPRPMSAILK